MVGAKHRTATTAKLPGKCQRTRAQRTTLNSQERVARIGRAIFSYNVRWRAPSRMIYVCTKVEQIINHIRESGDLAAAQFDTHNARTRARETMQKEGIGTDRHNSQTRSTTPIDNT